MRSSSRVATLWLRSLLPSHFRVGGGIFDADDSGQSEQSKPLRKKKRGPRAPRAPQRQDSSPPEGDVRSDPLFEKFLKEVYQGGKGRIPNPNHETRERFPDVSFSTAMRDDGFRRQVSQDFERWKGENEESPSEEDRGSERVEIGQVIEHASQLRAGDVIRADRPGAANLRLLEIVGDVARAIATDDDGDYGRPEEIPLKDLVSGRPRRVDDPLSEENEAKRDKAEKQKREERRLQDEEDVQIREETQVPRRPKKRPPKGDKETPPWARDQDKILDLARSGTVESDKIFGEGDSANVTAKRRMRLGDESHDFIWKPASGEEPALREGIPDGTYHQREAAAFSVDRLLGEGTVVPPTLSTGKGSYQSFRGGARTFYGAALSKNLPTLTDQQLKEHPDFNRINVLDMVLGNEDRHNGNVMLLEDEDAPDGLRFIAIDNGLSVASPTAKFSPRDYQVEFPWDSLCEDARYAIHDSIHEIDPKLHKRLKAIDHGEFVESLVGSGIREEEAVLAALVRLSALQRDRKLLKKMNDGGMSNSGAMRKFLFLSGDDPEELLAEAGEGPSYEELQQIVKDALR